jgi:hypothetical protein
MSNVPIRMTALGHEFLAVLREPKALAASGGLGAAFEIGKAVLTSVLMGQLGLGS